MSDELDHPPKKSYSELRESLESQMIEAINSGPPIEVTPEFWQELKERVHTKLAGMAE